MIHHNKRYIILPFNDLKKYSTTLPLKDYLTIKISTNIFQIHYTTTNTKKYINNHILFAKKTNTTTTQIQNNASNKTINPTTNKPKYI